MQPCQHDVLQEVLRAAMQVLKHCGSSAKAAVWRWLVGDGVLQQCLKAEVSSEKDSSWKVRATP